MIGGPPSATAPTRRPGSPMRATAITPNGAPSTSAATAPTGTPPGSSARITGILYPQPLQPGREREAGGTAIGEGMVGRRLNGLVHLRSILRRFAAQRQLRPGPGLVVSQ